MSLIGRPIKSKMTGTKGAIVDADRKHLIVSFSVGGVKIPLAKYADLIEVSEETRDLIEEYILSLKRPIRKIVTEE